MTEEDLRQIRQLISEELSERLAATVASVSADFSERLGAAAVSISADFSKLRQEMNRRFDQVDQRFNTVNAHLERMDTRLAATALELAGIHRAHDASDTWTAKS